MILCNKKRKIDYLHVLYNRNEREREREADGD
jgi:hypothetical protein